MPEHTVVAGEVLETLAQQYGVRAAAIEHPPENETLFETRKANILFEGDTVFIPELPPKTVTLEHDRVQTFTFRPRTQPIALRFSRAGLARRHEPIEWSVDRAEATAAHLDDEGWFRAELPVSAKELRVVLCPESDVAETRVVRLGHLDPHVEPRGVQQRLNNLGFHCGSEDGDVADKTRAALETFQHAHGLEVTGSLDEATSAALAEQHGT